MNSDENLFAVLIIEDHLPFQTIIEDALLAHPEFGRVEAFSSLEKALCYLENESCHFDAILSDLGLPGMSGIAGIPRLLELRPTAQILVLTAFADKEHVYEALNAGAHGYLLKSEDASQTVHMLSEMMQGGTPLDPKIAGMLLRPFQRLSPSHKRTPLSDREASVLALIAQGETRSGAADTLGLSKHTIDQYIRRIFEKLSVHSLPAAISTAHRQGLIDLSDATSKKA